MKSRTKHVLSATVATLGVVVVVALATPHHVGPSWLYPNGSLSPGLVATADFATLTQTSACGTYSQCHRKTSESLKKEVRTEYPNCPAQQEIDHIVPLALGGADDVKNLWCEPEDNKWNGVNYGYHQKDQLESYLVLQIKARNITPKDAQDCILQDWIACIRKYGLDTNTFTFDDPDN